MKDFAKRLNQVMIGANINTTELAKAIGVSHSIVSQYLHGKKTPSLDTLVKIAGVLKCSPDFLLQGSNASSSGIELLPGLRQIDTPVPVLKLEELKSWKPITEKFRMSINNGTPVEIASEGREVIYTDKETAKYICVRVEDEAMVSSNGLPYSISPGMLVYADPDKAIKEGDIVLAFPISSTRGVIRRYMLDNGKPVLKPMNTSFSRIEIDNTEQELIAPVVLASYHF